MPSSKNSSFKLVEKSCVECGEVLELNNTRDISRKLYCSKSCANKHTMKVRISNLDTKECLECSNIFKPTNLKNYFCSSTCLSKGQVTRSYKYLNNNLEAYIGHLLCKSERKHLSVKDILDIYTKQEGLCALSKVPLTCIKKVNSPKIHTNLSIDRINSNLGYEIGNIQLVCAIINIMKSNLTIEEFKWWIKQLQGGLENSKLEIL